MKRWEAAFLWFGLCWYFWLFTFSCFHTFAFSMSHSLGCAVFEWTLRYFDSNHMLMKCYIVLVKFERDVSFFVNISRMIVNPGMFMWVNLHVTLLRHTKIRYSYRHRLANWSPKVFCYFPQEYSTFVHYLYIFFVH